MKKLLFCWILMGIALSATAQKITLKGIVKDDSGETLIGASVSVQGTKTGVMTDIDGQFRLELSDSAAVLVVSYVGFSSLTVNAKTLLTSKTPIVELKMTSAMALEEVVVVGYGSVHAKSVTASARRMTTEKLSGVVHESKKRVEASKRLAAPSTVTSKTIVRAEEATAAVPLRAETDFLAACKALDKDKKVPTAAPVTVSDDPSAGQLTASEWNPLTHWDFWHSSVDSTFSDYEKLWKIYTDDRIAVTLRGQESQPIVGALVQIEDKNGHILWQTYSDNHGQAELFEEFNTQQNLKATKINIMVQGQKWSYPTRPLARFLPYTFNLPVACLGLNAVDIAFVVDATGSMGDEIAYLKSELADVITRVKQDNRAIDLQVGSVFYRDFGDQYVTKMAALSPNIDETVHFIKQQRADGGGDFPEAVPEGLLTAIDSLAWRPNSVARLAFLVLDAPPHSSEADIEKIHQLTQKAAAKGIRLIPITASGIDQSTEFLMKSLAITTNGTYIYLTDDSGIGETHLKATVDETKVEPLNDLLVRVISERVALPDCQLAKVQTQGGGDALFGLTVSVSPNPANDILSITIEESAEEAFISDLSGRILTRLVLPTEGVHTVDISQLANGLYVLTVKKDKAICSKKFTVLH